MGAVAKGLMLGTHQSFSIGLLGEPAPSEAQDLPLPANLVCNEQGIAEPASKASRFYHSSTGHAS